MSLYNQLHGTNPIAPLLLQWLDIDQGNEYESGRFRDIYLNGAGDYIFLYTRNGGGNREAYEEINQKLMSHPNYVEDYDDDFDSTYAYFVFTIPLHFKTTAEAFATGVEPKTVAEKFKETIAEMESMTPEQMKADRRFAPTVKMLEKITEELTK